MKKKIIYLFAHQDDELGCFVKLDKDISYNDTYVFFLTCGENYSQNNLISTRDRESLHVLQKLGLKKKNIFFIGRKLKISHYTLYLNLKIVYKEIRKIVNKIGKPDSIITHSWEGGHEDHDACNLIGRKIAFDFQIIDKSYQFSQYNAFKTNNLLFFKVFNPINKINGKIFYSKFKKRIFYIRLLFFYKSQIKIWFGLYPFVIYHYLFKGSNYLEKLNKDRVIKKPHKKKLLYEIRKFLIFEKFKSKTKSFLND